MRHFRWLGTLRFAQPAHLILREMVAYWVFSVHTKGVALHLQVFMPEHGLCDE